MADFLNIFTLCTQELICAVTSLEPHAVERSSTLKAYEEILEP